MSKLSSPSIESRAEQLDTIAAVLSIDRRDKLAELLTDQDVETLKHLVNEGMGDNTLRALTSDLAYLGAWSLAATAPPLAGARSSAAEIRRPLSVGSGARAIRITACLMMSSGCCAVEVS